MKRRHYISDIAVAGVKEDLSELSKTLTRQFWGVASFLAPPPQPEQKSDPGLSESEQGSILGIRSDFAEIGGKFRSGISRLSTNINVSEITKMATNLLQLESFDENDGTGKREGFDSLGKGAVGVTEDVVAFARDIAMHPETWLDFPLPDNGDFDMSDAQQEHALAVEQLSPRLAALRFELCPGYMSDSCFWKIYFVLLHPRLDKQDAELLSTPQIVEARASLGHELKNRNVTKQEDLSGKKSLDPEENAISRHEEPLSVPSPILSENVSDKASGLNLGTSMAVATPEIVKNSVERNETQIVDKTVIEKKEIVQKEDGGDDADDWLKEETSEVGGAVGNTIPIENEDDVSFSDLEEEDDGDVPSSFRKSNYSSDKDSRDWVQLGKSSSDKESANANETKESNDWLDVDDIAVS
ncbi:hypothetical protein DH2020_041020 [Rehmannia glutinosa]|uniref:BSD domain-containing protein n=1 Tax=Rehmannia glutinosa TaxID=99300 RepID=A0ABR0UTH5_REHGL